MSHKKPEQEPGPKKPAFDPKRDSPKPHPQHPHPDPEDPGEEPEEGDDSGGSNPPGTGEPGKP